MWYQIFLNMSTSIGREYIVSIVYVCRIIYNQLFIMLFVLNEAF